MDPKSFVKHLMHLIVYDNVQAYADLFEKTKIDDVRHDSHWYNALVFYQQLSDSEKVIFVSIIKQICIDDLSSFLAILDGSSYLDGQENGFILSYEGRQLNGNLQDIFFNLNENSSSEIT